MTELSVAPSIHARPGSPAEVARTLLKGMLTRSFPGRIALVSSFGAESAVLLHLVAGIDPATPVIFLDTGKLFPETLQYRDALCARLRLTDLRTVRPDPVRLAAVDPSGTLWRSDPDSCCWQRKVEPLDEALSGFDAWITGRKRFQGALRRALPLVEREPGERAKVNPLAGWTTEDIAAYLARQDLPRHPLVAQGYRSIGCAPCTRPVGAGEDVRDGRWHGRAKTECGIHLPRRATG